MKRDRGIEGRSMNAKGASLKDLRRFRENLQEEIDSAAQYRAMADAETRAQVAQVYRDLAGMEDKHAAFWKKRLDSAGEKVGQPRPSWRARLLIFMARRFGASLVLPTVASKESQSGNAYAAQAETRGTPRLQENAHARILNALMTRKKGVEGALLARVEGRHRAGSGNALRAGVLGANDGLCSNLSLVMGVVGANASSHTVLVTGLAGLLAGACSMALGEWVSVTSARELAEREIGIEASELEANPEDERAEIQLIYEAKGLTASEAKKLSTELLRDKTTALDVLAREELGINPDDLGGSAMVAAGTSFAFFALGAVIPVSPLFVLSDARAVVASVALSSLALLVVGAAITVFTGRSAWISALRQLGLGLAAAGITFGLGHVLGVSLGG